MYSVRWKKEFGCIVVSETSQQLIFETCQSGYVELYPLPLVDTESTDLDGRTKYEVKQSNGRGGGWPWGLVGPNQGEQSAEVGGERTYRNGNTQTVPTFIHNSAVPSRRMVALHAIMRRR